MGWMDGWNEWKMKHNWGEGGECGEHSQGGRAGGREGGREGREKGHTQVTSNKISHLEN